MGNPGTIHVQGFAVFGAEYMLSNCFPWGKDDDEEEEEEGEGGHSLRSQRTYGLVWTIRRECTQITASAQCARSWTCTYLAVASHQKDASQVLQSSWAQPALACRKMPELRRLKGLVVGVIVIFLHSIRQRKLKTLSRVPKPSLNWLHFYGSKGFFFQRTNPKNVSQPPRGKTFLKMWCFCKLNEHKS